ncbi:TIR domain-containing protein [Methylobacterium radiotolerans]|uniref:TIR domain-containing protein n=1 Tax=Methylobacterium radiotolerans TaxID=31998 RepID=UPI000D5CF874|nr:MULTISPECIES: TIR domain-containing protein [Methylobacterium]MDE3745106.1 TIR domain-containing protein [Methylobacterium radiotolerans]PVY95453.1 TIR-like protein DUF1863 [Methylobacterium organophilum]
MLLRSEAFDAGAPTPSGIYTYDAFATYATDPDRDLVRALESFVEGFHLRPTLPEPMRRELELCLDGRDFVIPRRARRGGQDPAAVGDIVEAYMRRSRSLLVLCGPNSRNHPWIDHEIRWWLENRPADPIYFGLTHGDPTNPAQVMPAALLEAGGGDLPIFFDLRGFYSRWRVRPRWPSERSIALAREMSTWRSVRPFREEAAKIVARLLSDALGGDYAVDDIEAAFANDERRAVVYRRIVAGVVGTGLAAAGAIAWQSIESASASAREADAEAHLQRSRVLADQGGAALPSALAHAASALAIRSDGASIGAAYSAMQDLVPIVRVIRPDGGDPAWTVRFVADDKLVLTGGRSSVLRLVDPSNGDVKARIDLQAAGIRHIAYDPASGGVFVGTDRGLVRLALRMEGEQARLVETGRALDRQRIGGVVLDEANGRVIVGLLQSGELWCFPIESNGTWNGTRRAVVKDPRFAEDGDSDVPSGVYGLALAGDRLVATGIDGVVSIIDIAKLEEAPRQFVHPHSIFAMAVSHQGSDLAIADDDGGLSIYEIATGKLRSAEKGKATSASVGRTLEGHLALSDRDRLPNVGLAINPEDDVIAVTSHDRSVRFLSLADLSPIGVAVHRSAPRDVAFGRHGQAITAADDGSMQIVRPAAQPEVLRIAGVDGFAALPDGRIVAWRPEPRPKAGFRKNPAPPSRRALDAVDPVTGARSPFGTAEGDLWSTLALKSGEFAFRSAASSKLHIATATGSPSCDGILRQRNQPGEVDMIQEMMLGPNPGTLATVTNRTEAGTRALHLWDLAQCTIQTSWPTTGAAAVAGGVVATLDDGGRRIQVRNFPYTGQTTMSFAEPVSAMSVSDEGKSVLVALDKSPAVCLCEPGSRSSEGGSCATSSATYSCRPLDALLTGPRGPAVPSAVKLSASGRFAVVQHRSALLLGTASSGWAFRTVSPEQLRQVTPPFAFDAEERMIAVPAGETGVRLLDSQTGKALAELPTPSRVMRIAFTAGTTPFLVTLDGSMLRVWDWRLASIRARICERWSPDLSSESGREVPPVLPRSDFCPAS